MTYQWRRVRRWHPAPGVALGATLATMAGFLALVVTPASAQGSARAPAAAGSAALANPGHKVVASKADPAAAGPDCAASVSGVALD
ncbi:MAG: hypothetical protein ACRDZX_08365, partial [Acidimicrobiales bacterium]